MKEKSKIEKNAEERQISLLSTALGEASKANGYWLNASGKRYPRLYPHGVSASPFNALFMALHSDRNGCNTNLFTLFSDAKARGTSVREHEQGVPFLYYNWNKYVHRNNPEEFINRGTYLTLDDEQKKQYKGVHNREIRTLFNIDQTTFPHVDEEAYRAVLQQDGNAMERGYSEADTRRMHIRFNDFLLKMRDNLVPVRYDGSGMPHYETDKDAVYMPRQKNFDHYNDYVQETLRQIVSAPGRVTSFGYTFRPSFVVIGTEIETFRVAAVLLKEPRMVFIGVSYVIIAAEFLVRLVIRIQAVPAAFRNP